MINNAKFISKWNHPDITLECNCKVDMNTGAVFGIEMYEGDSHNVCGSGYSHDDLKFLTYEYVVIDGIDYYVDYNEENYSYTILYTCLGMLHDTLMSMDGDAFNYFCGLPIDESIKSDFLFEILYGMQDDVIMAYYHKFIGGNHGCK